MNETQGHFVVIEGTDGSGKGTQIKPVAEYIRGQGIKCEVLDFPQYTDNIFGALVGRYLKGEFGGLEISPFLASLPYVLDRVVAAPKINKLLDEGTFVIANRYASSNRAFMAAKLPVDQRAGLLNLLRTGEYETLGIPKEELIILLDVIPSVSHQNVAGKEQRGYLVDQARDIHEDNLDYQTKVAQMYRQLARDEGHWEVVNCMDGIVMRSPVSITWDIIEVLKRKELVNVR